jgi:hypothetical protein
MREISRKMVKTRKPHQCFGCLRNIEKGERMEAVTVEDGTTYTYYTCKTCTQLLSEFAEDFRNTDDLFEEGCIKIAMSEECLKTPEELYDRYHEDESNPYLLTGDELSKAEQHRKAGES